MIREDGLGDLLEQDVLPVRGGRHDEAALALAERGEEVHRPHRQLPRLRLQPQALVRLDRRQRLEERRGGLGAAGATRERWPSAVGGGETR